jgi:hypothetical protein
MPSIEVTPEQAERLRAVREELAADVVGKYGHVRVQDAIEYLLDEHAGVATPEDGGGDRSVGTTEPDDVGAAVTESPESDGEDAGDPPEQTATAAATVTDAESGDTDAGGGASDDAMLDAMMNLLDTHDDKWGESSGDERYEVTLPDGDVAQVRTKDDVRALLFKHYR